ncbi:MAG: hypothetical protein ACFFA1_00875 [Promethearchaeota archaeon]
MSISVRWKRTPSIGVAVFLIGLAGIAQIPIILFAQIFLVVSSEYLLILVPLGATLVLAAAEILLTEALVRRKKGRRKQLFGFALRASLVVLGIFFAIYFLPFVASYVLIPPEPIRTLSRAAKFVIMINSAAIATVIIASIPELTRKTR